MTNTEKANEAIKAARLAASDDALGNEDAASTAGATAGRLAFSAGLTCSDIGAAGLCTFSRRKPLPAPF